MKWSVLPQGLQLVKQSIVESCSWTLDLVLPPQCAWCSEPIDHDQRLCRECYDVLNRQASCCQRCAMPLPAVVDTTSCPRCRESGWRFDRVLALGPYRGKLREAIILIKKPSFEPLAVAAGELLAMRLKQDGIQPDVVIPVPNHWTQRATHRTSAAESLASTIARSLRVPLNTRAITRKRRTKKQGMLAWSNRPANVKDAFGVRRRESISGKHVLLVDDVFTSGATASELTRCMLKVGVSKVTVAVTARGTGSRDGSST